MGEYRRSVEEAIHDSKRPVLTSAVSRWTKDQLVAAIRSTDAHRSALRDSGLTTTDPIVLAAYSLLTDRIRHLHAESQRRKIMPAGGTPFSEVEEAREATRRISAEYERLFAEKADLERAASSARFYQAFYESAKFILAESTWKRIEIKARELLHSTRMR